MGGRDGAGGGALSRDGGETWERPRIGRYRYGWAAAADLDDPETAYVSVAAGVRAAHGERRHGFVARSRGGEPWRPALEADAMPYALIPAPGRLYVGLSDGRVLHTDDAGGSWLPLPFRFTAIERSLLHVSGSKECRQPE